MVSKTEKQKKKKKKQNKKTCVSGNSRHLKHLKWFLVRWRDLSSLLGLFAGDPEIRGVLSAAADIADF